MDGDDEMIESKQEMARFATLITGLADYYKQKLSAGVIRLYWEGLKQFDFEAVEQAAWAHTQRPDDESHFMPRIGDLKKVIEGSTSDQGQIAWSKVDRAVRTVGPYWDVAFDDPIIHRVIADMGGWVQINSAEDKNWPFVAKEFINRYQAFKMTGQQPEHERYLIGMATAHNQAAGIYYDKPNVRLLGNVDKARQIASGVVIKQIQ